MRSRRLPLLAAFLISVLAAALTPGSVAASATEPLPVPSAFRLSADNGYTLDVIGIPPHANRPGSLLVYVRAKGRLVTYKAPATVTETSMHANLGELGEISVSFQRSNRAVRVPCGKDTIRFDSGSYEGVIEFRGEEGYTGVRATSAPGNIDYWLGVCGGGVLTEGPRGTRRGAVLHVRNPALGQEMSVGKRRPGAAAEIAAWVSEYSNGISIRRYMVLRMPGDCFTYDRRLRTATVRPPSPFAGSARFDLREKAGRRWSGDLTVDLPGKAGVPLTGTSLRAILVPA